MARGRKRKAGKRTNIAGIVDRILGPTPAREAHNDFHRVGIAFRMVPMIDTLLKANRITHAEWEALDYYRSQKTRAEDDLAQEGTLSPSRVLGGAGGASSGKIPANLMVTPAVLEAARLDRGLAMLRPIAEAVAVNDWSLSRWCIEQHGGRERYDGNGRFVAMVPNREREVMGLALEHLKQAARRISR